MQSLSGSEGSSLDTFISNSNHRSVLFQGWVTKQGSKFKTWKRRYMVLLGISSITKISTYIAAKKIKLEDETDVEEDVSDETVSNNNNTDKPDDSKDPHFKYYIIYSKTDNFRDTCVGYFHVRVHDFYFLETDKMKKLHCLKISSNRERDKQRFPFYFYLDNREELEGWKMIFDIIGLKELEKESGIDEVYEVRLKTVPVSEWTHQDVLNWLKYIFLEDQQTGELDTAEKYYKTNFMNANTAEQKIDGNFLLSITREQIRSVLCIEDLNHVRILLSNFIALKKTQYFNLNRFRVYKKVLEMDSGDKFYSNFKELEFFVDTLSDENLFQHTYLNEGNIAMEDLQKWAQSRDNITAPLIQKQDEQSQKSVESSSPDSSVSPSTLSTLQQSIRNSLLKPAGLSEEEQKEIQKILDGEPSSEEEEEEGQEVVAVERIDRRRSSSEEELKKQNRLSQSFQLGNHTYLITDSTKVMMKIKLVVTEITRSSSRKQFRKLISPIASRVVGGNFGLFHTSLIVGPWYLEWNDSSLIIPRKVQSGMAILNLDLGAIDITKQTVKYVADKLSKVIVDWNANHFYSTTSLLSKSYYSNCQHFVDAVLQELKIKPQFSGAVADFIKDMKERGVCNCEFKPNASFREKFNLSRSQYVFDTHDQLDNFVHYLFNLDKFFVKNNPSEYMLLKGFDRAFWLKHVRKPDDKAFQPSEKGCACQDPTRSGSIIILKKANT